MLKYTFLIVVGIFLIVQRKNISEKLLDTTKKYVTPWKKDRSLTVKFNLYFIPGIGIFLVLYGIIGLVRG